MFYHCVKNTATFGQRSLLRQTCNNCIFLIIFMKWSDSVSHSARSDSFQPHGLWPTRLLCPWDFLGKNTGVGCHFLLQEIFLTQGSNLGLLHCRQILYHLSHQGSPTVIITSVKTKKEWIFISLYLFIIWSCRNLMRPYLNENTMDG